MKKSDKVKKTGVRKFMTGESRYCQKCGKQAYDLFEIIQGDKIKNKLQYCKECYKNSK